MQRFLKIGKWKFWTGDGPACSMAASGAGEEGASKPKGAARNKKETPEEKRARKKAVKTERQERRQTKKAVTDNFKDEDLKKTRMQDQSGFGVATFKYA